MGVTHLSAKQWRRLSQTTDFGTVLLAAASSAVVLAKPPTLAPHGLHPLLRRLCSQMLAPPHGLHWLLRRLCSQMLAIPHVLHRFLWRLCGHGTKFLRAFFVLVQKYLLTQYKSTAPYLRFYSASLFVLLHRLVSACGTGITVSVRAFI